VYSRKTLDTLRQAVACGFRDGRALQVVPDLEAVRGEDGYKALVSGIMEKVGARN
jgi:hypothetical protein